MLKKSLLTSIALIGLNPIQASQTTHPQTTHPQHTQNPAHHNPAHPTKDTTHCPPCPCGGVGGWVLLPAGPGTPCHQGAAEEKTEEGVKPHHTDEEHHVTPHKPSLHPLPTPEEKALAAKLEPIQAHIFKRADPNHPNAEKKGEWGKALDGKVYFKVLGIWKHDPSVHATTDIISTGVKDRIAKLNDANKKQQQPEKPTTKPISTASEASTAKPDGPPTAPPPPPTGGKKPAKSWPKVNVPDKAGLTEGRVQSATTNPTKDNELEFGLGAPNRAQTGVTGKAIPEADTSGSKPAVPPPSNIKAELDQ